MVGSGALGAILKVDGCHLLYWLALRIPGRCGCVEVVRVGSGLLARGDGVDLEWYGRGSGVDLGGSGVDLGGSGVDLEWIWSGSGVDMEWKWVYLGW